MLNFHYKRCKRESTGGDFVALLTVMLSCPRVHASPYFVGVAQSIPGFNVFHKKILR